MNFLNYIAKTGRINQHPLGERGTDILLTLFPENIDKVLEVGCGSGHTAMTLSSNVISYYGIDSSAKMIKSSILRAKSLSIENCNFYQNNHNIYPFENNSFDVIFCESVLAILSKKDLKQSLKEIYRVLKPGGVFIANESLWKTTTTKSKAHYINTLTLSKFGIVQVSEDINHINLKKELFDQGFINPKFNNMSYFSNINNTKYYKHTHKSRLYSNRKKITNFLNPLMTLKYLYFKYWEKKMSPNGKYIESYMIQCEKKS